MTSLHCKRANPKCVQMIQGIRITIILFLASFDRRVTLHFKMSVRLTCEQRWRIVHVFGRSFPTQHCKKVENHNDNSCKFFFFRYSAPGNVYAIPGKRRPLALNDQACSRALELLLRPRVRRTALVYTSIEPKRPNQCRFSRHHVVEGRGALRKGTR
jgi:hypothetical protein